MHKWLNIDYIERQVEQSSTAVRSEELNTPDIQLHEQPVGLAHTRQQQPTVYYPTVNPVLGILNPYVSAPPRMP
jgi:hypothetical protein